MATDRWDGSSFQPASFPSLISFPSGTTDEVWAISAAELGMGPALRPRSFASTYQGYYDFAPEPGVAPFAFTAGSLRPPPPPVAAAPVVLAPTGVVKGTQPDQRLTVRSFVLRKTPRAIKMRLDWARGEGKVSWDLVLKARIDGRRQTRYARGGGQAGTRTSRRTIPIPVSWRGATISARLEVLHGGRFITRIRRLRF